MNDEVKNDKTTEEATPEVVETPTQEAASEPAAEVATQAAPAEPTIETPADAPSAAAEAATESPSVDPSSETSTEGEATPVDAEVKEIPHKDIKAGMTVRLHEKINDISPKGEKRERIQIFEGIVLNTRGAGDSRTMTVRKMSGTVGVEKIFPLSSPNIAKIEVVKVAKVRRGNLSYLRNFRRKLRETWMK